MLLSQFLTSLFVVLRLQEFLAPHNLCLIVEEDRLDNLDSELAEILLTKSLKVLTCTKYVTFEIYLLLFKFVTTTNVHRKFSPLVHIPLSEKWIVIEGLPLKYN